MPRLRPDGTHYPSTLPQRCDFCGHIGTATRMVFRVDDIPAHKDCRPPRLCSAGPCTSPIHALRLCSAHYNRKYYRRNPAHHRARTAAWVLANPDKVRARDAARDPAIVRASSRRWYWKNRFHALAAQHNARVSRLGLSTRVSAEQLAGRWLVFRGRCYLCQGPAVGFDHVKPLAAGGPHIPSNLRPACHPCNSAKSSHWKDI